MEAEPYRKSILQDARITWIEGSFIYLSTHLRRCSYCLASHYACDRLMSLAFRMSHMLRLMIAATYEYSDINNTL
jgi:hypothetical protein